MVIDTSALLALLFNEPEAESVSQILAEAGRLFLSSFTLLETRIVVSARKGPEGSRELELLLHALPIEIMPLTHEQSGFAHEAWIQYGKGRHKAGLNIGDCCSYALAAQLGEPLLYKGNDFGATDLRCLHV
ncbi:MAG: type II toxin-antitoxin system VapC family toxin [Verrucomicrobia bacterium]|nr:type II toxin-antitoxin system VapC family toxin [Verrucomicrobiota bacterium]